MNLNPATACQFTVPSHINYARRKELDKKLKRTVADRYRGMKGSTLFFEFPNATERDAFLAELETQIHKYGNQTKRINQ